jgi:uncharacterized membrane protein YqjE
MTPDDPQLRMLKVGPMAGHGTSELPADEHEPMRAGDELREEIQEAREQLGDTVESLARAYVRARVNERIKRTFGRTDSSQQNSERIPDDRPVSELTKLASEQAAKLVRSEIRLAQLELHERTKHARLGLVLCGVGGVLAFLAAGAVVAALVLTLASRGRRPWVAAVIVSAALLAAAAAAALTGRSLIEQAREERRQGLRS